MSEIWFPNACSGRLFQAKRKAMTYALLDKKQI